MKPINCFLILAFLLNMNLAQKAFAQSSHILELMDDYPIKIDGECSFFTCDTASLKTYKYVFVVSSYKDALFKKEGKFVMVAHSQRRFTSSGYIDSFKGADYAITLDVKKGQKISTGRTSCAGILTISQKNMVTAMKVKGINEEYEMNK